MEETLVDVEGKTEIKCNFFEKKNKKNTGILVDV